MKKLVFYSDQMIDANQKVDRQLLRLIGKERPKLGYIPSGPDPTRQYFLSKVAYYQKLGIHDLLYFDFNAEYDATRIDQLLACDAIHLSGGNTFAFLAWLQQRNLIPLLQEFVSQGKVLIGVSAGSILMSKTINIAGFADQNVIGLTDFRALGLVDWEFMPHWLDDAPYLEGLLNYAKTSGTVIYGCRDGDGIIVENDQITCLGEIKEMIR